MLFQTVKLLGKLYFMKATKAVNPTERTPSKMIGDVKPIPIHVGSIHIAARIITTNVKWKGFHTNYWRGRLASSTKPGGSSGGVSSSQGLQAGQGMPAPPHVHAPSPSQDRSGWFSQIQS
jgi:hypothetical protein